MDYFDVLLAKKLEDDRDPKVEGLSVTQNGRYHQDGVVYDPVIVNVPLGSKSITANGIYKASDDNLAGYSSVTVAVEGYAKKSIPNTPTAIATFNASALPMPSLNVSIEAIQSGTGDPSPSNVRPISGWSAVNVYDTGINIWDEEWEVGDIDVSGNPQPSSTLIRTKNFNPCKPNTTYKVVIPSGVSMYMKYYDKDKNFISPTVSAGSTITPPSNCYYFKFVIGSAYGTTYNNDISINYPSTDTSYHAYNGHTYEITLGDTRYGGTLDVVSGVLTVDKQIVDLGTKDYTFTTYGSATNVFVTYFANMVINLSSQIYDAMCSDFKVVSNDSLFSGVDGALSITFIPSDTYAVMRISDSRYNDATAFKSAMSGVQLVYELATPQSIQLTPTAVKSLDGTNNLWADTGDVVEASYWEEL